MKKTLKLILLFTFLVVIYIYAITIESIPDNIIIFEGETIKVNNFLGFKINSSKNNLAIETSSSSSKTINNVGKTTMEVSLFDNIFIKSVDVDVLPKSKVIPVGNIAGVKLYTSGVLVVGMTEIEGIDNKKYKPYENTGIEEGDTIISINDSKIASTEQLISIVNQSKGKSVSMQYLHDDVTTTCSITPVKINDNEYKLGLWVRDSAARSWNSNFL